MNRPSAIAIVGAAVITVTLYGLGRWDARVGQEDQAALASARAWLAANGARRIERARLLAVAQSEAARARRLAAEARAHAASDTVLEAALDRAHSATDSLPIVVAQRDSARAAVASWAQAFAAVTLKDRADSAWGARGWAAADSAERLIPPVLHVAECRWLGLSFAPRCLTRTTSFLVGVAGGAVAILLAKQ